MAPKICPFWTLKYEKIRHFCNSIAKILEKTRIFSIPEALGPPKGPRTYPNHYFIEQMAKKDEKIRDVCTPVAQILEKTRIFAISGPLGHKPPGAYFGWVLGVRPEMLKISLLGPILARFSASGQKCSQ